MDDFIFDDIGFDTGSYGDVSNLFDYDFSGLFDSFGGVSLPDLGFDLGSVDNLDLSALDNFDFSGVDPEDISFDDLRQYVEFDESLPYENIDITGVGSAGDSEDQTVTTEAEKETGQGKSGQVPTSATYIAQQYQNEDLTDPVGRNSVMITDSSGEVVAAIDQNGEVVKGDLEVRTSENPNTGQVEYQYVDKYGNVIGGFDENGEWFNGYGTESTIASTGIVSGGPGRYAGSNDPLGGTPVKNFGGSLATKEDVDKLLGTNAGGGVSNINNIKLPGTSSSLVPALLGGLLGALTSPSVSTTPKGYQSKYAPTTASRTALSPSGAPGSGGKRFISPVKYAAEGGLMEVLPGQPNQSVTFMAEGGLSTLGSYTHARGGRMLKGPGDGMSDSIPASIDGKRPARLATDEFVVPADVVSHLGNGSSDAGAKVLYDMMAKVRRARTGSEKQGKQINPNKFVPK